MNKIHHKRINNYNNYNKNYNGQGFKKKYSGINNINNQNSMNIYNEERRKINYYNNNNFNNQYNDYSYTYNNSNNNRKKNFHRYNNSFIEENLSKSTNESNHKKELMRVKINTKENTRELIIYKDEDIYNVILSFCNDNNIDNKLVIPLYNKINQSLNKLKEVTNNMLLKREDVLLLNSLKK